MRIIEKKDCPDIVVIGGGPVGSRAAAQLAGKGYRVVVLEKRAGIGRKSCCTGIVSRECATAYSIPPEVVFREVNSARVFSPEGICLRVRRPEVQACILNRAEFDRMMAGRAEEKGAEYRFSTPVNSISLHSDRVMIEAESAGIPFACESRAVIVACGFNPPLVRQLGVGSYAYTVNGAQVELTNPGISEVEVFLDQKIAPGFFSWIVPADEKHCLVGLLTHRSPGIRLKAWLETLERERAFNSEGVHIRFGSIPLKPLGRTYGERFLIVGDAAGQVKPTTGGGIYFGLLCADIAAETLDLAFKQGDLSARSLAAYEKAWRNKLQSELRAEYFARRIYERLSDRQIEALFSRLTKSGAVESILQRDDLSFDWHGTTLLNVLKTSAASRVKRLLSSPSTLFQG